MAVHVCSEVCASFLSKAGKETNTSLLLITFCAMAQTNTAIGGPPFTSRHRRDISTLFGSWSIGGPKSIAAIGGVDPRSMMRIVTVRRRWQPTSAPRAARPGVRIRHQISSRPLLMATAMRCECS